MNTDETIKDVFVREVLAVKYQVPSTSVVLKACDCNQIGRTRVTVPRFSDVLTALAMAAAVFMAVHLDPVRMLAFRPLASELVFSIPEGAGSRFLDFLLEAGEAYRSMD